MEPKATPLGFSLGGSTSPPWWCPFPLLAMLWLEPFIGGDLSLTVCTREGFVVFGGARRLWVITWYRSCLEDFCLLYFGGRFYVLIGCCVIIAGLGEVGRDLDGVVSYCP
eukprot:Gb_01248 [translate_table: standard]